MACASCGTIAMMSRTLVGSLTTSMPFMVAVPLLGISSVDRMRMRVVLPAPLRPIMAIMPLSGKVRLTSLIAYVLRSYVFDRPLQTNPSINTHEIDAREYRYANYL